MDLVITCKGGAYAFREFVSWQGAIRLNDPSLSVHPFRFDRVQPGALHRQKANQDTDTSVAAFDLAVMLPDPIAYHLTGMPRGIIPYHDQDALSLGTS